MKYAASILLGVLIFAGIWFLGRSAQSSPEQVEQTATINGQVLELEVMRTPEEQARGLSGREALEANAGMLFVYEQPTTPGFWMKEMHFPIDIIWIANDGIIVDITENLAPETFPQVVYPRASVQYVLEVNANWAKTHTVSIGDTMEFSI